MPNDFPFWLLSILTLKYSSIFFAFTKLVSKVLLILQGRIDYTLWDALRVFCDWLLCFCGYYSSFFLLFTSLLVFVESFRSKKHSFDFLELFFFLSRVFCYFSLWVLVYFPKDASFNENDYFFWTDFLLFFI